MQKRLGVKTMMFLAFGMFVTAVLSGCESDHHQRHGDYGYPGPGYEHGSSSSHNDLEGNQYRDWDRDRR